MAFIKVLLQKNQYGIDNEISQLQSKKEYFQNYVNKVIELGLQVQESDLEALFDNPKTYITAKITAGENLQVGSLTLNKEKLFDLIEKPAGTNELIESIEKDKQQQQVREQNVWFANRFHIENNVVTIKPEIADQIENRYSLFIENENQQTAYNKLTQIVQLINELNELETKEKISKNTELSDLMIWKNNIHEIAPIAVKRFK
ncbi:hypothetical protein [Flavobacterium columnare]|uniref:hypothetical protein n=1 Tax=Flavobacterium columnare TaxID=996 RepID=UPI000D1ADE33|nr:hypothetical protein [Flavobacterium columnare]PTD14376.1 hypothetical protein C6N29_07965 [Flavobacterium columnare]